MKRCEGFWDVFFYAVDDVTEKQKPKEDENKEDYIKAERLELLPQAKKELKEYLEVYNEFDKNLDKLNEVFDTAFDSPLVNAVLKIQGIVLNNFCEKFNIDIESLEWFIYDNEQGKNKLEADGIPIETVDDFLLMEMGIKYTLKNGKNVYLGEFNVLKSGHLEYSVLPEVTRNEEKEIGELLIDVLKSYSESIVKN